MSPTFFALNTIYDNFDTYKRPCSSCLYGSTAIDTPPMPIPGFYTADPDVKADTFLPCTPADACKGGPLSECAAGYAGFRCGMCAENYYRESGECTECPNTPDNAEFFAPECSVTAGYCSQRGTQLTLTFMVTFSFIAIYTIIRFRHLMSPKG
jgi:hypothetical protein